MPPKKHRKTTGKPPENHRKIPQSNRENEILLIIAQNPGKLMQKDIAKKTGLKSSRVSEILRKLKRRGLISHHKGKQIRFPFPTETGKKILTGKVLRTPPENRNTKYAEANIHLYEFYAPVRKWHNDKTDTNKVFEIPLTNWSMYQQHAAPDNCLRVQFTTKGAKIYLEGLDCEESEKGFAKLLNAVTYAIKELEEMNPGLKFRVRKDSRYNVVYVGKVARCHVAVKDMVMKGVVDSGESLEGIGTYGIGPDKSPWPCIEFRDGNSRKYADTWTEHIRGVVTEEIKNDYLLRDHQESLMRGVNLVTSSAAEGFTKMGQFMGGQIGYNEFLASSLGNYNKRLSKLEKTVTEQKKRKLRRINLMDVLKHVQRQLK